MPNANVGLSLVGSWARHVTLAVTTSRRAWVQETALSGFLATDGFFTDEQAFNTTAMR